MKIVITDEVHSTYGSSRQITEKWLILSVLCLPILQQSQRWWNVSTSGLYTSLSIPWWIRISRALRSSAPTPTASKRASVSAAGTTVVIALATTPRKPGRRGTARCTWKPGRACLSEVTLSVHGALKQDFCLYPPSKYHAVEQAHRSPRDTAGRVNSNHGKSDHTAHALGKLIFKKSTVGTPFVIEIIAPCS